jgi:hypothetical protein
MSTTRQTLVDIYHPLFREGYQKGRQYYFQEQDIFTDKQFVECLQFAFQNDSPQEDAKTREEHQYYAVGQLVGQMSGCIIPRQPHEDRTQNVQEEFLATILQEYGPAGQALIDLIREFWELQDQLAQMLDADSFEQIHNRGAEKGKGHV